LRGRAGSHFDNPEHRIVTDTDQVDLGDAAFLEPLTAASVKVRLADGEKRVQDLKLPGRR